MADQVIISEQGPQGDPGVNWTGNYDPDRQYEINDGTFIAGSSYIAIQPNQGVAPPNPTCWFPLALGGDASSGSSLSQTLRLIGLRA